MRETVMSLLLLFSVSSFGENICPTQDNQPWDKMDEKAFSKEAAIKQIKVLNELFEGKIEVAEEFIHQSNLILEGSFYRMEIDTWQHDPKNHKYAKERFCEFMAKRAYLVH